AVSLPPALALTASEAGGKLTARVLRAARNGRDGGLVRALDQKGLPLAEHDFALAPDATEAEIAFDMPIELRNGVSRIEIAGERSAGAVTLVDERGKRRRVGLVFGGTSDQAQPLLAPTYYLSRALQPFADVQEARGAKGIADQVAQLLDNQVTVLVLADVGAMDDRTATRVQAFVEGGGLLLRFAGPRLAAGSDPLVP
ncbi:LytTR family transcriptional regulator, partial [Methylobacterium sp. WL103]